MQLRTNLHQWKTTTNCNFFGRHRSPTLSFFDNIVFHSFYLPNIRACIFHVFSKTPVSWRPFTWSSYSHNNRLWRLHSKLLHTCSSFLLFLDHLLNYIGYFCWEISDFMEKFIFQVSVLDILLAIVAQWQKTFHGVNQKKPKGLDLKLIRFDQEVLSWNIIMAEIMMKVCPTFWLVYQ